MEFIGLQAPRRVSARHAEACATPRLNFSIPQFLNSSVLPFSQRDQRRIYRLVDEARLISVRGEEGFRSLQPVLVVALGGVGLVVRAAALVARERSLSDDARQLEHVMELPREGERLVGPARAIAQVDAARALQEFDHFLIALPELVIVANHRYMLRHPLAHLLPDYKGVFLAVRLEDVLVELRLTPLF